MKKKRGIALLITALMFVLCVTGCGTQKLRQQKNETTEEKETTRSDSVLIPCDREMARDRDMFVLRHRGLGQK